ncbi:hypothetical protein NC652_018497 [Populus alba x Populus x berolinensis]|nr:hypothetical protein NC652_018497 [Populus alba x Populus x berolinensis]
MMGGIRGWSLSLSKKGNLNMLTHHLYKNMCLLLEMASMGRRGRGERSDILKINHRNANHFTRSKQHYDQHFPGFNPIKFSQKET